MNILWLPLIVIVSALAGFLLRSTQLKKARNKVISLENEMLQNHAEILSLQKEIVKLKSGNNKSGNKDSRTPVVHLMDTAEEKLPVKERKF